MPAADDFVEANEKYAAGFSNSDLPSRPAKKAVVLTCMDARLLPSRFLGLEEGDAHVIRNAGGRVQDALRSIVVSQRLLGTNEILVIHHTHCGMQGLANEDLGADASDIDFLGFGDLEQSVRDDVKALKDSPLVPDDM